MLKDLLKVIFPKKDEGFMNELVLRKVSSDEQLACLKYCNVLSNDPLLTHTDFEDYNDKIQLYKKLKTVVKSYKKAEGKYGLSPSERTNLSAANDRLEQTASDIQVYKTKFEEALLHSTRLYREEMKDWVKLGEQWLGHVDAYLKTDIKADGSLQKEKEYLNHRLNARLDVQTTSDHGDFSGWEQKHKEILIATVVAMDVEGLKCDTLIKSVRKATHNIATKIKKVEEKRLVDIGKGNSKTKGLKKARERRAFDTGPKPSLGNRAVYSRRPGLE